MTTSTVNGSFNDQPLVQANTTGTLDLGDTTTIGNNTFNISGGANTTGNAYIDDIAAASFSAVGNKWDTDTTAATSYIDFRDRADQELRRPLRREQDPGPPSPTGSRT